MANLGMVIVIGVGGGGERSGKKGLIPVFLLIQSLKLSKCIQIKISTFYFFQLKEVLPTFL